MNDAAARSGGKGVQTEKDEMVFEILGEGSGQVASDDNDAARFVETLCQGRDALCVQRVFKSL